MNRLILTLLLIVSILTLYAFIDLSYSDTKPEQLEKNEMLEGKKESCKTFIDLSKLIISLSTGIFVLLPAFLEKIRNKNLKGKLVLYSGLISLIFSIIFGLLVISALAGSQRMAEYNIAAPHLKLVSICQWSLFIIGLSLCGYFLLKNLFDKKNSCIENSHTQSDPNIKEINTE